MKAHITGVLAIIAGGVCAQDVNDLISVNVTVANNSGFVSNLPQSAFTVMENGKAQQIKVLAHDNRPVSMGLIVDDSGSMREFGPGVLQIVEALVKNVDARDEMFLLQFNKDLSLTQDFTNDPELILKGLQQGKRYGPSSVLDGLGAGIRHVIEHAKNDKRVLVVISDGLDNTSKTARDSLVRVLTDTGISVYALGPRTRSVEASFTSGGKELLTGISRPTGGIAYVSKELDQLTERAKQIAREIHSQYLIGYLPSDTAGDGKFRKIEVKINGVQGQGVTVRARSGYHNPHP